LIFTLEYGHRNIALLLLENDANINLKPKNKSLFLFACKMGNLEVMKKLVEKKINITDKDVNGRNGVMHAIYHSRKVKFIHYLIQLGINVDEKDNNGDTAMLMISRHAYPADYIKLLLDNGSDPNIKDKYGKTALDNIIELGTDDLSSYYLENAGGKRAKDL
ncbi:MAG: ankyrin repeat domain-containing protein, partial [Spirochaetes bacterium]|nr:ankyrin repeat domain-containing protein [Spirochaetota bacterium]